MLLDALLREQGDESDRVFARRLGVPRSTWQLTRCRRKAVGLTIARAAIRAFPHLEQLALDVLTGSPDALEGVQDGQQAGQAVKASHTGTAPVESHHSPSQARRLPVLPGVSGSS